MDYMCSKFGVDSSSRFPFRARTSHTETKSQTSLIILTSLAVADATITRNKLILVMDCINVKKLSFYNNV